jgi:hypothetical protein
MKRIQVILLYICVSLGGLSAQEVNIRSEFDSARIWLGDQINFTVTVERPVSYLLSVPVFRDTIIKNIEVLKGPLSDTTVLNDGRIRIRQKYLITSFDSGFYQVPPVFAEFKTEAGIKRFYSDYAPLRVMRARITPPDTATKIFDIVKPISAPLRPGEILPWVLLAIIAGVLIWYAIKLIKKLKVKKTGEEPVIEPDPAHIIAFRELEKLKEEQLWQKGEIKSYYTVLSEILRQYLENRFGISSPELTTIETLTALTRSGFRDDISFGKLKTVLTSSDLVKFAKYTPGSTEHDLQYENAWDFVSQTRAADLPAVEKGETTEERREGQ